MSSFSKNASITFFGIQCDKMTDVAQMLHLLVYVRFVGSTTTEEAILPTA